MQIWFEIFYSNTIIKKIVITLEVFENYQDNQNMVVSWYVYLSKNILLLENELLKQTFEIKVVNIHACTLILISKYACTPRIPKKGLKWLITNRKSENKQIPTIAEAYCRPHLFKSELV